MTLGIDASRANIAARTGTEWYAWHVIQELKRLIPGGVRVVLYSREPLLPDFGPLPANWESRVLVWPLRYLWTQARLSWEMLVRPPDVLFVPVHALPVILPDRSATTLHDIAFVTKPDAYGMTERWYQRFVVKYAAWRADAILTVSNFSCAELRRHFDIPEKKLSVISLGCEAGDFAPAAPSDAENVLKRLGITKPFFLFVGRIEWKKNIVGLLRAFKLYRTKVGAAAASLVIVGKPGFGGEGALRLVADDPELRAAVVMPGYAEREDLRALYATATAFLFPSWYEGFGLPVLEAMAAGLPVIASESSSLPEVCGDAALLVPPQDEDAWAKAMVRVASVDELRANLRASGKLRVQHFTWRATAEKTWEVLDKLLRG